MPKCDFNKVAKFFIEILTTKRLSRFFSCDITCVLLVSHILLLSHLPKGLWNKLGVWKTRGIFSVLQPGGFFHVAIGFLL